MSQHRLISFFFPFFAWLPMLNKETIKLDIVAGITAGVLILPQAIALAQLAGMPPEYGFYTSIFPVVVAALYGSSWLSMSGPNTAMCIYIGIVLSPYASQGSPEWIQYAITLAFLTGIIQLIISVLRLGIIFNYFSNTVMVALVTGVGIMMVIQQIGNSMGVPMNMGDSTWHLLNKLIYNIELANPYAVICSVVTVLSGILIKRLRPKWPHLILAVIFGMLTAIILDLIFGEANTNIERIGTMSLSALPLSAPDFSVERFSEASEGLMSAAFILAFLGLMQSSVIARVMAAKSGQTVNINQEISGQALANIVGSFFSCFASCGSFNRSASNLESGARTPLSAIVSVITLALLVLVASFAISLLPISVMSGILILVGIALVNVDSIQKILALHGDSRINFLLILFVTLFGGLDMAIFLGIFLSVVSYLKRSSIPDIQILAYDVASQYIRNEAENSTVLRVAGNLFFGSLTSLQQTLMELAKDKGRDNTLIIAGENILHVDLSGCELLMKEALSRRTAGGKLQLWFSSPKIMNPDLLRDLRDAVGPENLIFKSLQ